MSAGFVVVATLIAAGPDPAPGVGVLSLMFVILFPGCFVGVESGSGIVEKGQWIAPQVSLIVKAVRTDRDSTLYLL